MPLGTAIVSSALGASIICRLFSNLIYVDVICRRNDAACTLFLKMSMQITTASYSHLLNFTCTGVSLKSQLLNLLGKTISLILSWKHIFKYSAMFYIEYIISGIIAYKILYVEPTKSTYNTTQDNFPLLECAIVLNLFVSWIFYLMENYYVRVYNMHAAREYGNYFHANIVIMTSVAQLLLERNIRLHLQRDHQQRISSVVPLPTLGAIRMAMLFMCLSEIFLLIKIESFYIRFQSFGRISNFTCILNVVIYIDFLYHFVRYVKWHSNILFLFFLAIFLIICFSRSVFHPYNILDTQQEITGEEDLAVPLLAIERRNTNVDQQEETGTEIPTYSSPLL